MFNYFQVKEIYGLNWKHIYVFGLGRQNNAKLINQIQCCFHFLQRTTWFSTSNFPRHVSLGISISVCSSLSTFSHLHPLLEITDMILHRSTRQDCPCLHEYCKQSGHGSAWAIWLLGSWVHFSRTDFTRGLQTQGSQQPVTALCLQQQQ